MNPLVASILQLTPQELLGLLPDGGSHSHCTETECSAFASMRTRLGPVDNIANVSTISELTEMAGQVAIEEAVKVVAEEVEEHQQTDMEVEEPEGEEWISVEGMDDAVKCDGKEMVKLLDELNGPGTEVKAVDDPSSDTEENIDDLLDLDTCETNDSITGDNNFKVSKAAWEEMQKTMAASQKETKKLNSSLTAIRGELNKLKRPAATRNCSQPGRGKLSLSQNR